MLAESIELIAHSKQAGLDFVSVSIGFSRPVSNREMSGAKGIEIDPEGKYYFVNA